MILIDVEKGKVSNDLTHEAIKSIAALIDVYADKNHLLVNIDLISSFFIYLENKVREEFIEVYGNLSVTQNTLQSSPTEQPPT